MKRAVVFALAALVVVMSHDIAATPHDSLSAKAALAAIDGYRAHVSPHLTGVIQCRFTPTCSAYGRESVQKYGFAIGSLRTIKRVARCGPWTAAGTVDPP
ncbi:MAG TPA: membrane protein insertion efficiency factor YidD [Thermoanaerobaculia bacterium]|nr:membrane protein insertion efficiency factor YidD [Thermoanaerobaculia bacterium]